HTVWAAAPASSGTPCSTRSSRPSKRSVGAQWQNRSLSSPCSAASTLAPKRSVRRITSSVRLSSPNETSTSGGSTERDSSAFTVQPTGPSGPAVVTIATPVGQWRLKSRNSACPTGRRRGDDRAVDAVRALRRRDDALAAGEERPRCEDLLLPVRDGVDHAAVVERADQLPGRVVAQPARVHRRRREPAAERVHLLERRLLRAVGVVVGVPALRQLAARGRLD